MTKKSQALTENLVTGSVVSAFWLALGAGVAYMAGRSDVATVLGISAVTCFGSSVVVQGYKDCKGEYLFEADRIIPKAKERFFSPSKVQLSSVPEYKLPLIHPQNRDLEQGDPHGNHGTYEPPHLV